MERDKKTARHADGIYVLGNSEDEVFNNLAEVFERAKLSGLTFKPKKVVIFPKQTQMFGWIKNGTSWRTTNHVITQLASAEHPTTVKKLRGWLGAFKQVMMKAFELAKESIRDVQPIHCPKPTDVLEFYPDYSEEQLAIGGWMKIIRPATKDKPEKKLLGGHFSQRLGPRKNRIIPFKGEALACRCLINHYRNYLRESKTTATVFSDNLPISSMEEDEDWNLV